MSLEAIEKVSRAETESRERLAAAEAEAKQLVADAEREGQALLQKTRAGAAEAGRLLLRRKLPRARRPTPTCCARRRKNGWTRLRSLLSEGL